MLPDTVQRFIDAEIAASEPDFTDLRAVFLSGTLKRSPTPSHTEGLIAISRHVLEGVGARVDTVRLVDHTIPPGVQPDMREDGWEVDDFPALYRDLIEPAHIVVLATPIWLGDQSSMTRLAVERLYGGKPCAAQLLYALSHIGFTIPPQADAYWVGEAGPGPSYLDDGQGARNHWTTQNTVFATWNMLHTARRLADAGGVPAHGNVTSNWDLSDPEQPNPEYR